MHVANGLASRLPIQLHNQQTVRTKCHTNCDRDPLDHFDASRGRIVRQAVNDNGRLLRHNEYMAVCLGHDIHEGERMAALRYPDARRFATEDARKAVRRIVAHMLLGLRYADNSGQDARTSTREK